MDLGETPIDAAEIVGVALDGLRQCVFPPCKVLHLFL